MQALLLVDIQNDFVPGGALAVPRGDEVIEVANRLMPDYGLVVATQDWHPPDHLSFASQHAGRQVGDVIELNGVQQVLWPDHCIQNSPGAAFCEALNTGRIDEVVRKGTDRRIDSYSGFYDNGQPNNRNATGMHEMLQRRGVTAVDVMGLATDYCVRFTTIDAVELGYVTRLVVDGCRGVELKTGDCDRAVSELKHAGIDLV